MLILQWSNVKNSLTTVILNVVFKQIKCYENQPKNTFSQSVTPQMNAVSPTRSPARRKPKTSFCLNNNNDSDDEFTHDFYPRSPDVKAALESGSKGIFPYYNLRPLNLNQSSKTYISTFEADEEPDDQTDTKDDATVNQPRRRFFCNII
jgi:hypothetical protein